MQIFKSGSSFYAHSYLEYGWIGGLNRRMSGTEEGQINRKTKKPLTKVLDHQNSTTAPLCLFLKCLESHWSAGHYSSKRYSLICFDDVGEDHLMVKHLPQAFIWIEMLRLHMCDSHHFHILQ